MPKRVLVVIDMQKDFIDGALGSVEAVKIVHNVKQLIKEFADSGDSIIFTQDTHHNDYLNTLEGKKLPVPHCIIDTDGWKINDDLLSDLDSDQYSIIEKGTFGFINWNSFINNNVEEIVIVGLCTDICVVTNALIIRTHFPNTIIKIVKDATAGTTIEKKEAAFMVARSCQIDII